MQLFEEKIKAGYELVGLFPKDLEFMKNELDRITFEKKDLQEETELLIKLKAERKEV